MWPQLASNQFSRGGGACCCEPGLALLGLGLLRLLSAQATAVVNGVVESMKGEHVNRARAHEVRGEALRSVALMPDAQ